MLATDIAPEAVSLARDNAAALDLSERVEVLACDLGEGIDAALLGTLDLVVSNPPYVPTAVLKDIPREVAAFEPALALDGGDDGLDVLRRLLPWCKGALKPGAASPSSCTKPASTRPRALPRRRASTTCASSSTSRTVPACSRAARRSRSGALPL